jgi:hypothetical protein
MITGAFYPLLAQVYRDDLGRGFRSATSQLHVTDVIPYAVGIALLIFVAWLVPYLRRRNDMSERCDDPQKLFRELCLTHELDRGSRQLLLRLAEAQRLPQPAQVFLTPTAFEPSRLPAALRGYVDEVKELRARLF